MCIRDRTVTEGLVLRPKVQSPVGGGPGEDLVCIDAGQWKAPKPRIRRFQRHPQSKKQLNPKAGCLRLQSMICKAGVKGGKSCLTPFRRSVDPMSLATELPLQPLRSNRAGNLGEHASENCETEGAVTRWTTLCGSVCCFHTCPRSTETPAVSPIRREAIPARNRRWSAALAATSPRRNDRLDRAFEQILRRAAVLHLPATQAKGGLYHRAMETRRRGPSLS